MLTVLVAPVLLLAFTIFDGPVSRLVGAKVGATLLFSTGVLMAGFGWHTAFAAGADAVIVFGGAALARRVGLSPRSCRVWMRRVTIVFGVFLVLSFAALALIATLLDGLSLESLSFDFGLVMSSFSLAFLLSSRHEQGLTRTAARPYCTPARA